MAKNARWDNKEEQGPKVVLASSNLKAHEMFGGLTLAEIGEKYDLADEDVEWYNGTLPNGDGVTSLLLTIEDVIYSFPMSRGMTQDIMDNNEVLLTCMMRTGFMSIKDDDGTPLKDENGVLILDVSKPYMSFGKPTGVVLLDENREKVFGEPAKKDSTEAIEKTIAGAAGDDGKAAKIAAAKAKANAAKAMAKAK
jgi:hypothetical protein